MAVSTVFNDPPPELKLPWDEVVKYDVEVNENWRPAVSWVTRRIWMGSAERAHVTRLHGPFTGAAGGAIARTIANGLNHYTRTFEIWITLLPAEREYILARKDNMPDPIADDEIPF